MKKNISPVKLYKNPTTTADCNDKESNNLPPGKHEYGTSHNNHTIPQSAVGFIGCGNMARAIIHALYEKGCTNILASDPDSGQLSKVSGMAETTASNQKIVLSCKYIFLCIKPQNAEAILNPLIFPGDAVPISIMAGLPLKTVMTFTKTKKAVRVMPNLNACVKKSYNAFCSMGLTGPENDEITSLLSAFGTTEETPEHLINAVTGIAGSGPAYVFRFFKGLLIEAEKHGFSPAAAVKMCGTTIAGSIETLLQTVFQPSPENFSEAIKALDEKTDSVCSKGGTTIEGIQVLDENHFTETASKAAAKAIKRAEELSN